MPEALAPAERAADELSAIRMDVAFDPAIGAISGEMSVTWRNPASQPLQDVWFRLFPNAFYYGEGGLQVADVTVDGAPVVPELALDDTALRVPLPAPVDPGESAEMALTFTSTVPADSTGSYGIFSRDTGNGSWVLADWYPILAIWEEGDGWALPEVTSFGDPTYAPSAFYDVQVTAPDDLEVVATGVLAAETKANGAVTRHFVAGPARDFVLVADDDNAPLSQEVDDTLLTLWTPPSLDPAAARANSRRPPPAPCAFTTSGSACIRRGRSISSRSTPLARSASPGRGCFSWTVRRCSALTAKHHPEGLATVVAHEMAHLWWGILVGGDSNKHSYIQEGLATVSSLLYLKETLGPEAAAAQLDAWVTGPASTLLAAGDAIVDVPLAAGDDATIWSDATYGKGSLGFLAIREEIGAAAFETALHDVATRYAWGEMTPDDLRAAFERASGQGSRRSLEPLVRRGGDDA